MKTFYSIYRLETQKTFSGVHKESDGLLIKFVDDQKEDSFSLYHPILSLGDLDLDGFFKSEKDREHLLNKAQKLTINSNEKLKGRPESYYSASSFKDLLQNVDKLTEEGFEVVKLKYGNLSEIDFKSLEDLPFEYIFDFNGRERSKSFKTLSLKCKSFLNERLRYIEDPYQEKEKLSFNLASDFIEYGEISDFNVIKPTGFNHSKPERNWVGSKLVVTSYLDHPIGQLLSAKWAVENEVSNLCGLWTHSLYKRNAYSELFTEPGIINLELKDDFIGLLSKEDWKEL